MGIPQGTQSLRRGHPCAPAGRVARLAPKIPPMSYRTPPAGLPEADGGHRPHLSTNSPQDWGLGVDSDYVSTLRGRQTLDILLL